MGDFLKAKELLDFLEATFSEQELPLQDRAFYYFLSVNIYFQIGLIERCDFLCEKMLSEYADITDSFSQVVVWQSVAWYYFLCNNLDRCREYAKKIIDKSVKYSFNFYLCIGKMLLGASTIETPSLAIEYIRDGYNSLLDKKNGRNTLSHSLYKLILGTIYLKSEQFDLCLDMLKDTIPECIAVDENCYLAELYILQGKCHYEQRNIDAAIYSLRQAVEIAQRNGSFYPLKQAQELLSNFK
jgi:hypothetical protein